MRSPRASWPRPYGTRVTELEPEWLLDLHEGVGFRQQTEASIGSTIIYDGTPTTRARAEAMLAAVNATIERHGHKFVLLPYPVPGGIARSAVDLLDAHTMILETTRGAQPLELRVRQHKLMVHRLLDDLKMLPSGFDPFIKREAPGRLPGR